MKKIISAAVTLSLLALSAVPSFAGQALVKPVSDLVRDASLIAVINVTKVTKVDVPTGSGTGISSIYVAEAEVETTIKSDQFPVPTKRKIALVGSTIPRSTAVWRPIETKRYLAFLTPDQGHYNYSLKYNLREVSEEEKLVWYDFKPKGPDPISFKEIKLEEAIARVHEAIDTNKRKAEKKKK